jgi:hypothetical protein
MQQLCFFRLTACSATTIQLLLLLFTAFHLPFHLLPLILLQASLTDSALSSEALRRSLCLAQEGVLLAVDLLGIKDLNGLSDLQEYHYNPGLLSIQDRKYMLGILNLVDNRYIQGIMYLKGTLGLQLHGDLRRHCLADQAAVEALEDILEDILADQADQAADTADQVVDPADLQVEDPLLHLAALAASAASAALEALLLGMAASAASVALEALLLGMEVSAASAALEDLLLDPAVLVDLADHLLDLHSDQADPADLAVLAALVAEAVVDHIAAGSRRHLGLRALAQTGESSCGRSRPGASSQACRGRREVLHSHSRLVAGPARLHGPSHTAFSQIATGSHASSQRWRRSLALSHRSR